MKDNKYLLIVFFLLFGILFGPNFYIAGISLRVIATIMGLLLLFSQRKKILIDDVFCAYIIYVMCYVIISVLNGAVYDDYFFKGLLNWHLPCILLYLLVPSYIDSLKKMNNVCCLVISLLLFDVLISLGQFFNISFAWDVGNAINAYASEISTLYMERYDVSMGYLGVSIINGICASVVDNGYFITTSFPLLFILKKNHNKISEYDAFLYISVFLTILASFLIQQRMCFYLIVLFFVWRLWTSLSGSGRVLLIILAITFITSTEFWLANVEFGRLDDASDSDRAETYLNSISMIFDDARLFCLGGEAYYRQFFEHTPHNTIIGAWVYSGVLGFMVFLMMIFLLLKKLLPVIMEHGSTSSLIHCSLAECCLLFIVYSMTHSTGIHNGKGLYFWLFYGLFLHSYRMVCCKWKSNLRIMTLT